MLGQLCVAASRGVGRTLFLFFLKAHLSSPACLGSPGGARVIPCPRAGCLLPAPSSQLCCPDRSSSGGCESTHRRAGRAPERALPSSPSFPRGSPRLQPELLSAGAGGSEKSLSHSRWGWAVPHGASLALLQLGFLLVRGMLLCWSSGLFHCLVSQSLKCVICKII